MHGCPWEQNQLSSVLTVLSWDGLLAHRDRPRSSELFSSICRAYTAMRVTPHSPADFPCGDVKALRIPFRIQHKTIIFTDRNEYVMLRVRVIHIC